MPAMSSIVDIFRTDPFISTKPHISVFSIGNSSRGETSKVSAMVYMVCSVGFDLPFISLLIAGLGIPALSASVIGVRPLSLISSLILSKTFAV